MKLPKIFLFILMTVLSFLMWAGYQIKPGLYVHAEEYEFDCRQADLIANLAALKQQYGYEIPEYLRIKDGKQDSLYYIIYFYYPRKTSYCSPHQEILTGKVFYHL